MKQQFIGLQHCRCGVSWAKHMGFFERTDGVAFCLKRTPDGKKRIHIRNDEKAE